MRLQPRCAAGWAASPTAALLLAFAAAAAAMPPPCKPLPPGGTAGLTAYLRRRFNFAPAIQFGRAVPVAGTCYLRLDFTDPRLHRNYIFFLAPDRRYLMPALYELGATAPSSSGGLMATLLTAPAPSRGPAGAPVTLVAFSDFECPFCRRLAAFERALPAADASRLRIVFRFFPLTSIHPWALTAARAAGCAYLQSGAAFWRVHDFLFGHQPDLTAARVLPAVRNVLGRFHGFDLRGYDRCVGLGESVGIVRRDRRMGQRLGISATPTFFVNGRRYVGVASEAALESAISSALADSGHGPGTRPPAPGRRR